MHSRSNRSDIALTGEIKTAAKISGICADVMCCLFIERQLITLRSLKVTT